MDQVHDLMDDVAEQQEVANEISEAISNPVGFGQDVDEVSYPNSSRLDTCLLFSLAVSEARLNSLSINIALLHFSYHRTIDTLTT